MFEQLINMKSAVNNWIIMLNIDELVCVLQVVESAKKKKKKKKQKDGDVSE